MAACIRSLGTSFLLLFLFIRIKTEHSGHCKVRDFFCNFLTHSFTCLRGLQRLAGPWDELANKYNAGSQAKVAKVGFGSVLSLIAAYPDLPSIDQVDCTVEEELCSEQGVRGYPKCVMSAA